jgi:hypothetical protein
MNGTDGTCVIEFKRQSAAANRLEALSPLGTDRTEKMNHFRIAVKKCPSLLVSMLERAV